MAWRMIIPNLVLVALTALLLMNLVDIEQDDILNYRKLQRISDPSKCEQVPVVVPGKQQRSTIHKTIIMSEDTGRVCLKIVSDHSELVFTSKNGRTEIVEHLNNLRCDMQEELYYYLPDGREAIRHRNGKISIRYDDPEKESSWVDHDDVDELIPYQRIRHIEADNATYYYGKDLLIAERVQLARYAVPGHEIVDSFDGVSPLMEGVAKSAQFSFVGEDVHFRAYRLKAKLYSSGGLF